jgi:hypothetical protein
MRKGEREISGLVRNLRADSLSGLMREIYSRTQSFFLEVRLFVPGEEKDASGRGDREHLG